MAPLQKTGCYKLKVRFFQTLAREDEIRWYVLPEGSPWFPGPHKFGGLRWANNRGVAIQGPGEMHDRPFNWDAGLPPVVPAVFAGEMDWFANGIPDKLAP